MTRALWFQSALLADGWTERVRLELDGGRIAGIGIDAAAEPGDEIGGAAVPGLCNVHSHAFQRAMAGLVERAGPTGDDFWSWRELMYRFLERLDPDGVEAIAALAYVEMLEAGFTRVGEFHYLHHDPQGRPYARIGETAERIAAAAAETGIALTLLPVYYAQGGFGAAPATAGQRRFLNHPDRFARLMEQSRAAIVGLDGARVGIAPHSLRAVTPEHLLAILPLAGDPEAGGGPIHIHAAEQIKEVEACVAWSGRRPVRWLLDEIGLDRRWCLIHATHLDDGETRDLAASGAVAGLCPITEANLGDGVFPAAGYLAAGGAFGVGTDSNVLIDAAQELRMIEYAQRLTRRARNVLAAPDRRSVGARLFLAAQAGGDQALRRSGAGLAVGAPADIVALDLDHPTLIGRSGDALLDSWIFAGRDCVETVWRAGAKLVCGGRHRARDAVARRYGGVLKALLA